MNLLQLFAFNMQSDLHTYVHVKFRRVQDQFHNPANEISICIWHVPSFIEQHGANHMALFEDTLNWEMFFHWHALIDCNRMLPAISSMNEARRGTPTPKNDECSMRSEASFKFKLAKQIIPMFCANMQEPFHITYRWRKLAAHLTWLNHFAEKCLFEGPKGLRLNSCTSTSVKDFTQAARPCTQTTPMEVESWWARRCWIVTCLWL